MKRLVLIVIGLIPLPLGYLLNHLMMTVWYSSIPPMFLLCIAMYVIWFLISMISTRFFKKNIELIILLNAPAFIIMLLNLFQEYIIGHYWMNFVGASTQFFFLPFIKLAFTLTSGISSLLANVVYTTTFAYIAAFVCLILVTYIGCKVGERLDGSKTQ